MIRDDINLPPNLGAPEHRDAHLAALEISAFSGDPGRSAFASRALNSVQDSLVTGRFGERMRPAMGNSFMQKFMLMVVAGLVAAGMIYVFRHIVEQAIWESGDGWQESMQKRPKVHKY